MNVQLCGGSVPLSSIAPLFTLKVAEPENDFPNETGQGRLLLSGRSLVLDSAESIDIHDVLRLPLNVFAKI